ncbi:hypothetical protein GCM10027053_27490 [Intrasporangium mesophilum]
MRRTTTAIVGAASVGAIWASWHAGLASGPGPLGNVTVVAGPPQRHTSSAAAPSPAPGSPAHSAAKGAKPSHTASPSAVPATVDGALVGTPYGNVQVRLTHVGPRITDVRAVQLTDSSRHSVSISAYAAPILRQEALAAQSAQIDMVSGATFTSEGYQQSLQAAIDAAHL